MRIDAVGLPIDRLQLRSAIPRPQSIEFVLPPSQRVTSAVATPVTGPTRAVTPSDVYTRGVQIATQAAAPQRRAGAADGSLADQLRRQRLSLGKLLTGINRQLEELAAHPAN